MRVLPVMVLISHIAPRAESAAMMRPRLASSVVSPLRKPAWGREAIWRIAATGCEGVYLLRSMDWMVEEPMPKLGIAREKLLTTA